MNKLLLLALLSAGTGIGTLVVDPAVNLQASTPGTPQTGHINVTGTVLAGTVYASSSGSTDKVVSGWATAPTGFNFGGDFRTASTSGRGVFGSALSPNGFTYGGDFRSASINGRGVFGYATSAAPGAAGIGGEFRADGPSSKGVYGYANSTTGSSYGGYFINASSQTAAVYGENKRDSNGLGGQFAALGANGIGAICNGTAYGIQAYGDRGIEASGTSVGVKGSSNEFGIIGSSLSLAAGYGGYFSAQGGIGIGVSGISYGAGGIGVYGASNGTNSDAVGGQFVSFSPAGKGVYAAATSTSGFCYGGLLESDSTDGRGAYGFANNTSGTNFGVYGRTASLTEGYGVYSIGRTGASGTKSFRIDDPLDPEHKYLNHYCSEGPLPLNVYQGHVTTDARGYAWIQMPDYYDEINKDPEYQLTVVDESDDFVQAKVSKHLDHRKFQIRTSKPGVYVSWEVKATRNDRFVQAYGAPVETEKPKAEQGLYQSPELYNQPPIKGVNFKSDLNQAKSRRTRHPKAVG